MRAMLALLILIAAAPTAAAVTNELDASITSDCIILGICIDEREGHWGAYLCLTRNGGDLLCLEALQFVDRIIHRILDG